MTAAGAIFQRQHSKTPHSLIIRFLIVFATVASIADAAAAQAGITFTFANGQITGASPAYYEFDVMVQGSEAGTRFGDGQVYINYDTTGFHPRVTGNPPTLCADIVDDDGLTVIGMACPHVEVVVGALLMEKVAPGAPYYDFVNIIDNEDDRLAVTTERAIDETSATELPTTPVSLLHVKIEIADSTRTAGLTIQQSLMEGQQFYADQMTQYAPVTASDADDSPLRMSPVGTRDADDELPKEVALRQNYPNPFNPATNITYDLPAATHVELQVFDLLGKEIRTLVDAEQAAGTYAVLFDGADLATGLYLYRLRAGGTTLLRTMVLVK